MGAEREETNPNPKRVGTESGLGKTPGGHPTSPSGADDDDGGPAAVDFDALHAALGDPLHLDDVNGHEPDALLGGLSGGPRSDSSGRSNAQYASARPHTIPPSYTPAEDPNAPAVIVATEDTVPSAPPLMTARVSQPPSAQTPLSGVPFVGSNRASAPPVPAYAQPQQGLRASARPVAQMTMRMPSRPPNQPSQRREKTPTIVMRVRGPSAKQKLIAFMAMVLLVTGCGIAVIVWRKPRWLGLDPNMPLTAMGRAPAALPVPSETSAAPPPVAPPAAATAVTPPATASAAAPGASTGIANVPPVKIRPRLLPPPASTASAPHSSRDRQGGGMF